MMLLFAPDVVSTSLTVSLLKSTTRGHIAPSTPCKLLIEQPSDIPFAITPSVPPSGLLVILSVQACQVCSDTDPLKIRAFFVVFP